MNIIKTIKNAYYTLVVIAGIINENIILSAKKAENRKNVLFAIAGISGLIYFAYFYASIAFNQIRLQFYGENIKAVVTKVYNYKGRKGVCYEFTINGHTYKGSRGRPSNDIEIGDSMYVTYLPSNPQINMKFGDEH